VALKAIASVTQASYRDENQYLLAKRLKGLLARKHVVCEAGLCMCIFLRISGFARLSTKGQMTEFVLDAEARKLYRPFIPQKYSKQAKHRHTIHRTQQG
jgi:hypothetical protein